MTWRLCTDPWTRTEKPILMRKWDVFGPFPWVSIHLNWHHLDEHQRVNLFEQITQLSETLAINAQVVSRQPSLKALTHQTVIIWKGQRWVKLITQSASHANACREPDKFDGFSGTSDSQGSSKIISINRIERKHVYCPSFCIFVWWCPLVHTCFYCSFTALGILKCILKTFEAWRGKQAKQLFLNSFCIVNRRWPCFVNIGLN